MKLKDFIWIGVLIVLLAIMVVPPMSDGYQWLNGNYPYVAGFVKFFILATMGDMLSTRIRNKAWGKIPGLVWRALVYGFLGMLLTLVMPIFNNGVIFAMEKGLLPFAGSTFCTALFTSICMNLLFAPTFMAFHRVTDTMIDMHCAARGTGTKVRFADVLRNIDFADFVSFVVCKTVPIFWIPAHTITFLLPNEYRVMFAAILSVAMGIILSFAKGRSVKKKASLEA